MAYLGDKAVGDVVKVNENGTAVNYIIVHKGKPSTLYDSSCDGVWLLRQDINYKIVWDDTNNDYANSSIHAWLNGNFLNTIDEKIRAAIKTVRIPYKEGTGDSSATVQSGVYGLSCKIFLLSFLELGYNRSSLTPVDGAKLSYFSDLSSRIAKDSNGTAADWWLRSPFAINSTNSTSAWGVASNGGASGTGVGSRRGTRPAFVLPSDHIVYLEPDGSVSTSNATPTITSDKNGSLGTLTSGFTCKYSVNDEDPADSVAVTLCMDSTTLKSFTATKDTQYTYTLSGTDWLKITNGSHTFEISATDGKETANVTATFTRTCNQLTTTLTTPLAADDRIKACSLKIGGSIPADAFCTYEVTNNAKDTSPVWEDCTIKVKNGMPYAFNNKTAANGFAFNFRITIQRGASNMGGYIAKISGGFE